MRLRPLLLASALILAGITGSRPAHRPTPLISALAANQREFVARRDRDALLTESERREVHAREEALSRRLDLPLEPGAAASAQ